jgi:hypothetical protein
LIELKPWFPRFLSFDWGFDHAAVTYWHATDGESYWTYREWVTSHMTAPEIAAGIIERTPTAKEWGKFDERRALKRFYAGPDVFSRKTSDRTVAIELDTAMATAGFGFSGVSPAAAGPGDRILGWNLCYQLLKAGKGKISPACPELIKAIPAAVRDYPLKGEDAKKTGDVWDDCRDAWRYGWYTSSIQPRIPIEIEAAKAMTAPLENLLARSVQYKNAMVDIRRRRAGLTFGR